MLPGGLRDLIERHSFTQASLQKALLHEGIVPLGSDGKRTYVRLRYFVS
jgi:hypothetical protein